MVSCSPALAFPRWNQRSLGGNLVLHPMRNHWTSEIFLAREVLFTRVPERRNNEQRCDEKPLDQRNIFGTRSASHPEFRDRHNNEQSPMRNHWTSEIKLARKVPALRTPEIGAIDERWPMRNHWTSEILFGMGFVGSRPLPRFTTVTAYYTIRYTVPSFKPRSPVLGELLPSKPPFRSSAGCAENKKPLP